MNKFSKIAILSTTLLATTLAMAETASARDRYPYWRHGHHVGSRTVAAGVFGLAAGVIVGSALAAPAYRPSYYQARPVYVERDPVYVEPEPVYGEPQPYYDPGYEPDGAMDDGVEADRGYFPQKPRASASDDEFESRQAGNLEPWSSQWRSYCSQKYRTFNQKTGTYHGVDGRDHFCTGG